MKVFVDARDPGLAAAVGAALAAAGHEVIAARTTGSVTLGVVGEQGDHAPSQDVDDFVVWPRDADVLGARLELLARRHQGDRRPATDDDRFRIALETARGLVY